MKVPFLDLKAHHAPLRDEFMKAIEEVIDSGAFAGGKYVESFEQEFADYCGTAHAIGVGSGTESLWLILEALGIGPGDEVITVPSSFFATAEAISHTGATPVFVDVCEATCNMNPSLVENAITTRTKAIVPVHLFGQTADMEPLRKISDHHGIHLVEDAAQAHGAEINGKKAGSIGIAGSFSFYPGKNLGALGEGGAVVTNDAELAGKMRMLRDHGQSQKYHHKYIGWNARMDGIQGALLSIKLKNIEQMISNRNSVANRYSEGLKDQEGLVIPQVIKGARHVWHLYVVRVSQREEFMSSLNEMGIACGIHYPVPIHLQEAYQYLNYKEGDFPVAEKWAKECVSLPMFPELDSQQVDYVIKGVRDIVSLNLVLD